MTPLTDAINSMNQDVVKPVSAHRTPAGDAAAGEGSASPAGPEDSITSVLSRTQALADRVAQEVQEHPIRSLAIAAVAGFLVAASMKGRILPAMLRSALGVATAVAVREIAARGLGLASFEYDAFTDSKKHTRSEVWQAG